MLRILHIGLGPLGKIIVSDLAKRGIGTLVGAVDVDASIVGKSVSAVAPESGFACTVRKTISEGVKDAGGAKAIDAAVLATSSDLAKCAESLRELIALGLPVVSTCEELLYPWLRHRALAEELDRACKASGARILGTGVNPGFMMDTLPVALTAVCRNVRRVTIKRIQDATTRRIPFQQKIGAGLDDAAFGAKIRDGTLRHVGLGESLHFVSEYLGLNVVRWEETIEAVKAERDLTCGLGPIKAGRAAGVRQVAKGWTTGHSDKDEPVITMEFQAAIAQAEPRDEIVLEAEPPIHMIIPGAVHGDVATSAITLNAIPALMAAKPGLQTMATVPVVRYVAGKTGTGH
jgi:4-hydroxy-tetrahydrodipicolinate reductase